jgi:peptidoglycan/LPS O-acetylase OafA/YrhL
MSINTQQRILEFDGLRAFMCLQVALYHYCNHYNDLYGHAAGFSLYFPVHNTGNRLFILLTGFVTLLSLERKHKLSEFWISRAIRLYPSYWVAVILTALVVGVFSLPGRETTLGETMFNLTMLQRFFFVKDVDGAYWALAAIILFYLCLSIVFTLKKMEYLQYIVVGWLAAAVIVQLGNVPFGDKLEKLLLAEYVNMFIAGIAFYKLSTQPKEEHWYYHFLIGLCLASRWLVTENFAATIVDMSFFGLFYLLIHRKLSFLNNRALILIGSVSYPMYLIHQNIGYVIIRELYAAGMTNQYVIILTPLFACWIVALTINYYIEKRSAIFLSAKYRYLTSSKQSA